MKRVVAAAAFSLALVAYVAAQAAAGIGTPKAMDVQSTSSRTASANLEASAEAIQTPTDRYVALAMTTPDYPVTPGDSYALSFVTSAGPVAATLVVEISYSVNLANIGTINGRSMRFVDLKAQVEKRVLEAYPLSSPRLVIQSCGLFPVYLRGEVPTASIAYLWGLSRLSDLWPRVTPYASNRDVSVRSAGGSVKVFDLYKAGRTGDFEQDPLLKPGDTVVFSKYSCSVSVEGEVRRPGTYQLLPSDDLRTLIDNYCDGFSSKADSTRLLLSRIVGSSSGFGEAKLLDYPLSSAFKLQDSDSLVVSSREESLPVAYFEGALVSDAETAVPDTTFRVPYVFYPGESIGQASRGLKDKLSPVADLASAYVLREGATKSVDLSKFIYGNDFSADFPLVPNDEIFIPFRQPFVYVAGAVALPGRYPYAPDRKWDYYIGLAGGFDESQNSFSKISIVDVLGKTYGKGRVVLPEDRIVARQNDILYNLGRFATVAAMIVSMTNLYINIQNMK